MRHLTLFLLLFMPTLASAQGVQGGAPLDARVVGVEGARIEIDRGLLDGLRQGDRVRFLPPTGGPVDGHALELTDRTASVQLDTVDDRIDVGTRAEAYPSAPAGAGTQGPGNGVEHPPWQSEIVEWPEDKPLLAPIQGLRPEEREWQLHGRFFASADLVKDGERDDSSGWMRTGTDLYLENMFGFGGTLRLDVEWRQSQYKPEGGPSETDGEIRIDRLAYAFGGDRHRPLYWQVGRFLQEGFPEFGVLDGAEAGYRFKNGHRVGGSFGYLPILYGDGKTGDDSQFALHYRLFSEDNRTSFGAGLQKTWHESEADRDLIVLKANTRSDSGLYLRGDVWLDLYGGDDTFKDGTELTRALASGGYRSRAGNGFSATATLFRFPQLLSTQVFTADTAGLLFTDREIRRMSLDVFRRFTTDFRGSARVSYWGDQEDSGIGGELRCNIADLLLEGSDLGGTLFADQGRYTDSSGIRLDAGFRTPGGRLRFLWETADYQNNSFTTADSDLLQHRLRGSWDTSFAEAWSLSLYLEQRSGDSQDSQAAGFYLQKSL